MAGKITNTISACTKYHDLCLLYISYVCYISSQAEATPMVHAGTTLIIATDDVERKH